METLKLEIITPNGLIFDGNAISVTLPGKEGEFGVLANHSSLTTLLNAGVVDVVKEDKSIESILIDWGLVEVDEAKVVALVEGAVAIRGESEGEISKSLQEAKELLESIKDSSLMIATVTSKLESAAKHLL
ncbi:MAG: ATP synthase F1 subunit epsilon [Sulfurimonas sp.]|jgi:F-type H+-transporting ATPase subunit epsilon|nr:ATP synthase F1 subunit epsilon [Sulfurimonadaceae bacterium]